MGETGNVAILWQLEPVRHAVKTTKGKRFEVPPTLVQFARV
jgi:hypothetical protein